MSDLYKNNQGYRKDIYWRVDKTIEYFSDSFERTHREI